MSFKWRIINLANTEVPGQCEMLHLASNFSPFTAVSGLAGLLQYKTDSSLHIPVDPIEAYKLTGFIYHLDLFFCSSF